MPRPEYVVLDEVAGRRVRQRGVHIVENLGLARYVARAHVDVRSRVIGVEHEIAFRVARPRLPFRRLRTGPLDPALCRTAQRIVDTAALSAKEKRTLALLP